MISSNTDSLINKHMDNVAIKTASILLNVEAVKIRPDQPFTWASGWKSPIYCDNRMTLSFPEARTFIKVALANLIRDEFLGVDAIAGVATAGIPQGALVADMLGLPFLYVRSKPKGHGMENLIEGKVESGQKMVVLEDLVSTGGSSLAAVDALKKSGVEVMGLVSIFTYGFDVAEQNFKDAGVKMVSLSDYEVMLDVALQEGVIKDDAIDTLKAWRESPSTWNK